MASRHSRKEHLLTGTLTSNGFAFPGDEDEDPVLHVPKVNAGEAGSGYFQKVVLPWEAGEHVALARAVASSMPWDDLPPILRKMGFLRTADECSKRWVVLIVRNWTKGEEQLLVELHDQHRDGDNLNWVAVAAAMAQNGFYRSPICFKSRHDELAEESAPCARAQNNTEAQNVMIKVQEDACVRGGQVEGGTDEMQTESKDDADCRTTYADTQKTTGEQNIAKGVQESALRNVRTGEKQKSDAGGTNEMEMVPKDNAEARPPRADTRKTTAEQSIAKEMQESALLNSCTGAQEYNGADRGVEMETEPKENVDSRSTDANPQAVTEEHSTMKEVQDNAVSDGSVGEGQDNCADGADQMDIDPKDNTDARTTRGKGLWDAMSDARLADCAKRRHVEGGQWDDVSRWLRELGIHRSASACRQRYRRLGVSRDATSLDDDGRNTLQKNSAVLKGRLVKPKPSDGGQKRVHDRKKPGKENSSPIERLRNKRSIDGCVVEAAAKSHNANVVPIPGVDNEVEVSAQEQALGHGDIESDIEKKLNLTDNPTKERMEQISSDINNLQKDRMKRMQHVSDTRKEKSPLPVAEPKCIQFGTSPTSNGPKSSHVQKEKSTPLSGATKTRKEATSGPVRASISRRERANASTYATKQQNGQACVPPAAEESGKKAAVRPNCSNVVSKRAANQAAPDVSKELGKKAAARPRISNATKKRVGNHAAPLISKVSKKAIVRADSLRTVKKQTDNHVSRTSAEPTNQPSDRINTTTPTSPKSNAIGNDPKSVRPRSTTSASQSVANEETVTCKQSTKKQLATTPIPEPKKQIDNDVHHRAVELQRAERKLKTVLETLEGVQDNRNDTGLHGKRQGEIASERQGSQKSDTVRCGSPQRRPALEVIDLVDDEDVYMDVDRTPATPGRDVIDVDAFCDSSGKESTCEATKTPQDNVRSDCVAFAPKRQTVTPKVPLPVATSLVPAISPPVKASPALMSDASIGVRTAPPTPAANQDIINVPLMPVGACLSASMPTSMQQAQTSASLQQRVEVMQSTVVNYPSLRQPASAVAMQRHSQHFSTPAVITPISPGHLHHPDVSCDPNVVARAKKMRAWITNGYSNERASANVAVAHRARIDGRLLAGLQMCPMARPMKRILDMQRGYDRFPDLMEVRPDAVEWTRDEDACLVDTCRESAEASWLEIAALMKERGYSRSCAAMRTRYDELRKLAGLTVVSYPTLLAPTIGHVHIRGPPSNPGRAPIATRETQTLPAEEGSTAAMERSLHAVQEGRTWEVAEGMSPSAVSEEEGEERAFAETRDRPRGRPRERSRGRSRGRPRGRGSCQTRWTVKKRRREPVRWSADEDRTVLKGAEEVWRGLKTWSRVVIDLEVLGYFRSAEECRTRGEILRYRRRNREEEDIGYDDMSNDGDSELSEASGGGELGEIC